MTPERTLDSRRVYSGHIVGLRVDTVELADGKTSLREIVEHGDCVVVVPLDASGDALLVRQYRKAMEAFLLEAVAGGIRDGESPEQAAQRELAEETGYAAGRLRRLAGGYASPGFCTEFMHIYLADDLVPTAAQPDDDEAIEVVPTPLAAALEMIERGDIRDVKSIAALLLVRAYLQPVLG